MLDSLIGWFGSRGNTRGKSLSIPVFDGAFKPNNLLEEAEILVEHPGLVDVAASRSGRLFAACDRSVIEVSPTGKITEVTSFDRPVTALALMADDALSVGLGNKIVTAVGTPAEKSFENVGGRTLVAVTALYPEPDGGLLVCDGSKEFGCQDWAWDLMGKKKDGRLIRMDCQTGDGRELASGLAYAFGAYSSEETGILVSQSWDHGVNRIGDRGGGHAIDRLPGYPCRFAPARGGGFWLSLFSSRTQLVEFVLKENDYRAEMMKTIDPRYWISPSFGSGADYLEPLQGGGVKQMGILKPWAPPRSYGLLVRFNADMTPQYSLHSRVGGRHHGICAAAQVGDTLYALSRGSGRILKLSVPAIQIRLFGEDAA